MGLPPAMSGRLMRSSVICLTVGSSSWPIASSSAVVSICSSSLGTFGVLRDDGAAIAADLDAILIDRPALHDEMLTAAFEIFLHQLAIHLDHLADACRVQQLGLMACMHISRSDILGFEQAGVLRHDQDRVGHGTAKRGVLEIPWIGVLDAFC